MTTQTISLLVSLAAMIALAAVFLRVRMLANAAQEYASVQGGAYRIRAVAFWVLVLVGLPVSVWLLRAMPYDVAAAGP